MGNVTSVMVQNEAADRAVFRNSGSDERRRALREGYGALRGHFPVSGVPSRFVPSG